MSSSENKIDWPLRNSKVAKLLGIKEATIRSYQSQERYASQLIKGEDFLRKNLGVKRAPTLMTVWTKQGVIKLAGFSRSRKAKIFLEKQGLTKRKRSSIESNTLDIVEAALDGFAICKRQYNVDFYRIDLYLPEYKLAIECDEFGHASRSEWTETGRQSYLEIKLGCEFIRFNPNEVDFNIGKVINKIFQKIQSVN